MLGGKNCTQHRGIVICTEREHPLQPAQAGQFLLWLVLQGVCDCRYLCYGFARVQSKVTVWLLKFQLVFFLVCFIWQQRPPSLLPSPWETLVPDSATSAMSTPCSCAMKPRTENIAKPDTKLVPLLRPPSSKQSLCHTYVMEVVNEHRRNRGSHFFFFFFTQPSLTRVALTSTAPKPHPPR